VPVALTSQLHACADDEKVRALMDSIAEIGLQEPVRAFTVQADGCPCTRALHHVTTGSLELSGGLCCCSSQD